MQRGPVWALSCIIEHGTVILQKTLKAHQHVKSICRCSRDVIVFSSTVASNRPRHQFSSVYVCVYACVCMYACMCTECIYSLRHGVTRASISIATCVTKNQEFYRTNFPICERCVFFWHVGLRFQNFSEQPPSSLSYTLIVIMEVTSAQRYD